MALLPVLDLRGAPRELGRAHGEGARDAVAHNLELYFQRFAAEAGLPPAAVLTRGARFLDVIDALAPDYGQTIRGIAEGSGRPLLEIAALNARYEIMYSEFSQQVMAERGVRGQGSGVSTSRVRKGRCAEPGAPWERTGRLSPDPRPLPPEGCTAFAALPEATPDGRLRLGQNWDWIEGVVGVLVRVVSSDGFRVLAFSEAGIAGGKIGLNSAGLGLAINGLASDRDDWRRLGLPFHVRTWRALNARTLADAVAAVEGGERACAANYLLAQADEAGGGRAVDVETAPGATCRLTPQADFLSHANHFSDPTALNLWEPLEAGTTSHARGRRMAALLGATRGRLDGPSLQTILADHEGYPGSICAHPDQRLPAAERYATVFSTVIDLHAREMRVASGNPCRTPFERFVLG